MKPKQYTILLHPIFFLSLLLLLLNDFYLKYTYHNWLTGKLSDFAGLFAFTLFLFAFVPLKKVLLLCISALFFCWWKSGFSDSLIFFLRNTLRIPVTRTIDYTDLIALFILPLTCFLKAPVFLRTKIRSAVITVSALVSLFAFCATSLPKQLIYYQYRENEILFRETFYSPLSKTEILEHLDPRKEGYKKDSIRYYRVTEYEDFYYRIKGNTDSLTKWFPVANNKDSSLFIKKISTEFYTIPAFVLQGDTLNNLELSIYPSGNTKKPTTIVIESFQKNNYQSYKYYSEGKFRKDYKKYFNRIFSK